MLNHPPFERATVLKNVNCPFCGVDLSVGWTKEHIVGRKFVPRGVLNRQWNLILRACQECNNRKSDLEDDISAISMLPDLGGVHAEEDDSLKNSSQRKLKSRSRKTGKPIAHSQESIKFSGELMPGIRITGDFIAPPQIDPIRVYELCRLQLAGFFFFQTYDEKTSRGGFWLEGFHPISSAIRSDWGNALHLSFMRAVKDWETRFHLSTADGFYRAITKRDPSGLCWAWAVEWNRNLRTIGFYGSREVAQTVIDKLDYPSAKVVGKTPEGPIKIRSERRIDDPEDTLFDPGDV